ncbi:hypothetical protein ACFFGT_03735 [Mucilaginibacter angelicae]|uniref:Uncharacterized protein n=1 Tax=Mucilaginibacter angelicae TaxID=869718 RepID=A0ABV6L0Q4_9SPHI
MKTLKIAIALLFLFQYCFGQALNTDTVKRKTKIEWGAMYKGSRLDTIRVNLDRGDKQALFRVAQYLDSNSTMTESLGYHILHTKQSEIARRLINENCIFLRNEFTVDTKTTAKDFLTFLMRNIDKISFSYDAYAYLITPLDKREAKYEIRELTQNRKAELKQNAGALLNSELVKHNNINQLIRYKDPAALFNIVSLLYANRSRFDSYQSNTDEYINLIQLLTGTEIGVEDGYGKMSFHIDKDFEPDSRLNLLIYFAKNYTSYKWDDSLGIFRNKTAVIQKPDKETVLFQLLNAKTDSVAINAFISLTQGNVAKVKAMANDYNKADISFNWVLPTFPYRFLSQMVVLTDYCKNNHVDFLGSEKLRQYITKLKNSKLSFKERYAIEDKVINNIDVNEITAFEYWCLINERDFDLTYSAGRILDKFYSKNWYKIVHDQNQLKLYLKKAGLYQNIGIIGISNNFIKKFIDSDSTAINLLKRIVSTDEDITRQTEIALKIGVQKPATPVFDRRFNGGNYDTVVYDLSKQYQQVILRVKDSLDRDNAVAKLFSTINYDQIELAFQLLEPYKFKWRNSKYTFMDRDFGFISYDFDDPILRSQFIKVYKSHTQSGVYAWYLSWAGSDYMNAKKHILDYDKIYELLKFDVVNAFVGGGGATHDNEIYALIKLLELKFSTTLRFPKKLCNSGNLYGCNSLERASEWMKYLKDKGLLKLAHNTPISFNCPLAIDEQYRF